MPRKNKKLLIIAMVESIHTARSIETFVDSGFHIYVASAKMLAVPHPKLESLRKSGKIRIIWPFLPRFIKSQRIVNLLVSIQRRITWYANQEPYLRLALKLIRPQVVQSMEIQTAAYPVLSILERVKKNFIWIVTNWGGELSLFSKFPEHRAKMVKILELCDVFSCECERDQKLALALGFKGKTFPIIPITGGMDVPKLQSLAGAKPRFRIALKGYSGFSGRAIFALKALELCADKICGRLQVTVFSTSHDTQIAVRLFEEKTGLSVENLPIGTPHEKILQALAESVLYIGVGISDGISTACLEAMATGAFPIQSNTSCCTEWFIPDESGFAVDPEDIPALAEKITFVLEHPEFVTRARAINHDICVAKLNPTAIREKIIRSYSDSFDIL